MSQPSVESYFGKRKRKVGDDIHRRKLLKTGENLNGHATKSSSSGTKFSEPVTSVLFHKNESEAITNVNSSPKAPIESFSEKIILKESKVQIDIRESLKKYEVKQQLASFTSPVKFHLLGSLSPAKKNNQGISSSKNESECSLKTKQNNEDNTSDNSQILIESKKPLIKKLNFDKNQKDCPTDDIIKSAKQLVSKIKETQKKLKTEKKEKQELSLKGIKDKIKRSSKLNELKKSISRINEHIGELIDSEQKKLQGTEPKLSKFKEIEVEIPLSPKKNTLNSPVKHQKSPCKPAYERYASLVETTTSLPLPFRYQKLYELFRSVDTVCSMMINRGEVITFKKLKPAVEEMTRKNFNLQYLGQMATVLPNSFSFHQEKLRNFGSTSKTDKYELVITPTVPREQTDTETNATIKEDDIFRRAEKSVMTPKVLKARRDGFYNSLLERTKDFHQEFLNTLVPPMAVNRNDLKRWHPNFEVDMVPDVNPQELPETPSSVKATTAKEILDRAHEFLNSNARLQKALEAAAETSPNPPCTSKVSLEIKRKVDARLDDPLKGLPKSLLEKVRARQSAKALVAMRMTPTQEKEVLTYNRLPLVAKIVRTIFINEQKGVILFEIVLEKVQFSFNRNLSLGEVESYVRLLAHHLPEWLAIVHIRNADYLKINKSIDVTSVFKKIDKIVDDKKKEARGV